jgi:hypothetical protein
MNNNRSALLGENCQEVRGILEWTRRLVGRTAAYEEQQVSREEEGELL